MGEGAQREDSSHDGDRPSSSDGAGGDENAATMWSSEYQRHMPLNYPRPAGRLYTCLVLGFIAALIIVVAIFSR